MAYSIVPYVNSGDAWSASQHNTYIRDNFSGIWPYTTAGDMAYTDSSTSLSRLPVGANTKILNMKSGVPSWNYRRQLTCCVSNYVSQTIPRVTWTKLSFDYVEVNDLSMYSESSPTYITVKKDGYYLINGYIKWAPNSTETREVMLYTNGAYYNIDTLLAASSGATSGTFSMMNKFLVNHTASLYVYQGTSGDLAVTECRLSLTYWGS